MLAYVISNAEIGCVLETRMFLALKGRFSNMCAERVPRMTWMCGAIIMEKTVLNICLVVAMISSCIFMDKWPGYISENIILSHKLPVT